MIWIAIAWWGSGVLGYFLTRSGYRAGCSGWTVGTRNITIFVAVFVPIPVFASGVVIYLDSKQDYSSW